MPYFKFNNKKVYYKIQGEGKPILLLQGNTMSSKMFVSVIGLFKRKYKVILIDFPGHGRSESLEEFETDFWFYNAQVCKVLIEKLEFGKVSVIGTSGGALVALNLALEYPELINVIIADSFEGEYPLESYIKSLELDRKNDKKKFLARLIWIFMHGLRWKKVVDADTKVNIDFYKTGKSFFHKSISELSVRTYLTGSMKDEYCDYLDKIYDNLKTKNNQLNIHLFDSGYHPAMISNKKEFFKLIQSIIK